jgi:predicted nucleotide-binding protein
VFICHASEDKRFTRKLAYDLSKNGMHVWYDELELNVGDSIVEKINQGIKESKFMVVVLSKSSVDKLWCKK